MFLTEHAKRYTLQWNFTKVRGENVLCDHAGRDGVVVLQNYTNIQVVHKIHIKGKLFIVNGHYICLQIHCTR